MYMVHVDYERANWSSMILRNAVTDPQDHSAVLCCSQKHVMWVIMPAKTSNSTANNLYPSIHLLFALNVQYNKLNRIISCGKNFDMTRTAYKNRRPDFFYCCVCILCGNSLTGPPCSWEIEIRGPGHPDLGTSRIWESEAGLWPEKHCPHEGQQQL